MKQIEVSIMGQSYLLGCPEGGEQQLRHAVSHVDREMCAIRDSGKLKARERIAVLAALNLAFELAAVPDQARIPPGVQADHEQGSHTLSPEYMNSLIQRVDAALNQDGHLL